MFEHEFRELMQGLAESFSKAVDARFARTVDRWFWRFEKFAAYDVKSAFNILEEREDRFPSLSRLLTYVHMVVDNKPKTARPLIPCNFCDGSGIVRATDDLGYRPIFKCPRCDNCGYNYPVWKDDLYLKGYTKTCEVGWDIDDEHQIKGLALFINTEDKQIIDVMRRHLVWKKAPEEMCKKAWELYHSGWRPRGEIFDKTKYDAAKERLRKQTIEKAMEEEQ